MNSRCRFLCHDCGAEFPRKYNLARHITRLHQTEKMLNIEKTVKSRIICPLCQSVCVTFRFLDRHLQDLHNIKLKVTHLSFLSETEFLQWKEQEEITTVSVFTKDKIRHKKNGDKTVFFPCNRSGVYKNRGKGRRTLRTKGTCKIGFCCAARITATFHLNGEVEAEYHSTHVGHDHQFCYLPLPTSQERIIADKLKKGINVDQILNEVRDEITASSALEKKHFINRKTLFNIMQKYNITDVPKSKRKSDTNIEYLKNEFMGMPHNPFLIYKKPGETHAILDVNETMIVIMNDVQVEMLKKFSSNKIYLDSVTSEKKNSFHLTALVVIDEYGEEFPCCFCISDYINETILSFLFETIKTITGTINTNILVSNSNQCYYNAWEKIMTTVNARLLGKWHVEEDWKKNLNLIREKGVRNDIHSELRNLLEEPNKEKFLSSMSTFLTKLSDNGYDEFHDYLTTKYWSKLEVWASCYRTKECLNNDMVLEDFHRLMKHLHTKVTKQQNFDILLHFIFKIIREKVFNRLKYMEDCTGTSYAEKLYKRHRRRKEVENITTVESNQWQVTCGNEETVFFVVKDEQNSCDCKRRCKMCAVCVHMFSCTCNDYLIMHNLCKHIHAVRMQRIQISQKHEMNDNSLSNINADLVFDDVCQILEIGSWITNESKNNMISKLNLCSSLLKETECENITIEMEEEINSNLDNILNLMYGNTKVTVDVESVDL